MRITKRIALSTCPICKTPREKDPEEEYVSISALGIGTTPLILYVKVFYSRCLGCGVDYQSVRLSDKTMNEYYTTGIYRDIIRLTNPDDTASITWAKKLLAILSKAGIVPIRHLDFGSARGMLLQQVPWGKVAVGVEIDKKSADFARTNGCKVYSSLDKVSGKFDVITASEVVEHLTDPVAVLAQLAMKLTPTGIILITVPNRDEDAQTRNFNHLFAFDYRSLKMAMKRAGLKITAEITLPEKKNIIVFGGRDEDNRN